MLHFETIDAKTLQLLKQLQSLQVFKELRLVGGTALALQIGHRKSVDIDLFGKVSGDEYEILNQIQSVSDYTVLKKSENINIFLINGIKVDIVNYPYKWISQPITHQNIQIAGLEDIVSMKLSAITGRGTKKDFIDLFFLLNEFDLRKMFCFYNQKYPDGSEFLVLKSLTYFEDADKDEMPVMLTPQNWTIIKNEIQRVVKVYTGNFA